MLILPRICWCPIRGSIDIMCNINSVADLLASLVDKFLGKEKPAVEESQGNIKGWTGINSGIDILHVATDRAIKYAGKYVFIKFTVANIHLLERNYKKKKKKADFGEQQISGTISFLLLNKI